jgi:ribosomal protein S11
MPKQRQSDNPAALTEQVHGMVTKAERAKIQALAKALGTSLSGAVRILIRAGFETDKVKSLTPQEEDTTA